VIPVKFILKTQQTFVKFSDFIQALCLTYKNKQLLAARKAQHGCA